MARLPRLAVPGWVHLLTWAGHNGQAVCRDATDRDAFLEALREACTSRQVKVHGWCLGADHLHLLLAPPSAAALAGCMQALGRRYVGHFNRRHGRSGTLWAGRFGATPVPEGLPLLQALVFVDGHALRRGQVEAAEDDGFSSARHHLGLERLAWMSEPPGWWALGNTPFEREAQYRQRLAQGLRPALARAWGAASRKGWLMEGLQDDAGLQPTRGLGRPLRPRPPGRPKAPKTVPK